MVLIEAIARYEHWRRVRDVLPHFMVDQDYGVAPIGLAQSRALAAERKLQGLLTIFTPR